MNFAKLEDRSSLKLIFVFVFLALMMAAGSYVLFTVQKSRLIVEKQNELASICRLKVQQIENWRRERLGNAESVSHNKSFINDVKNYQLGIHKAENFQNISFWIENLVNIYHYPSILLLDKNNKILIKTNAAEQLGPNGHDLIQKVLEVKRPIMSDLHRNSSGFIHLDLVIPLYEDHISRKNLCGILFYRIDPNYFLFPLIQTWPTPSETSETVLIRRAGDSVLILNELRNKKNTALNFYIPQSKLTNPSVNVVLGKTGNFEGIDYRDMEVLANLQKIADSPWFITTKVDKNELLKPLFRQAFFIILFTTFLIFLTGVIVYMQWRLQLSQSEKEKLLYLKHLDYLVKYANDIIILGDKKGHIFEVNEKAVTTYGYTREELLKMNIKHLKSNTNPISINRKYDEILNEQGSVYEMYQTTKNGTIFPVEISARIIDVDGEKFVQAIIRDITERKAIEEALRESEEIYRRLINTIPDIIFRCDLKGNILFVNDSKLITTYFGNKNELIGENILSFVAPDEMEKAMINSKLMYEYSVGPVEYKLNLNTGKRVDFEINGDLLRNKEGVAYGMVFILRDITLQKNFEESLRMAKEKAEESDRLKSAFLANMSHEIRTPMNGILGFSELLYDDTISQEERFTYINVISENSRHLMGIVNDIIDISKIDSNQLAINNVWFNLNQLMEDLFMTYENEKRLKKKDHLQIVLQKSLNDEQSVIFSDDIRLRQILYNLLGNALKFTKNGGITFGYRVVEDKLHFSVQDTGKGVARENQAIIFERFRQEEDTYTRYFGGTGLGLSISKGLVELLGGKLWMESEEGVGSTFYFTIKYQSVTKQS